jgi:hypothetical protein
MRVNSPLARLGQSRLSSLSEVLSAHLAEVGNEEAIERRASLVISVGFSSRICSSIPVHAPPTQLAYNPSILLCSRLPPPLPADGHL